MAPAVQVPARPAARLNPGAPAAPLNPVVPLSPVAPAALLNPVVPLNPVAPAARPNPAAPARARLAPPPPGQCLLWLAPARPRPGWAGLLSPAERHRADGLAGSPARDAFITSRAMQRLAGSRYAGQAPAEVIIDRDCPHCQVPGQPAARHGRPRLRDAVIDYSVAHTDRWVLLAVTGAGRIGTDIEAVSPAPLAGLARAALTQAEREALGRLPAGERPGWLLRAWTRKEAALKVTGLGLAVPPGQVDVQTATVRAGPGAATTPGWPAAAIYLYDVAAPPGHVAALASTVPLVTVHRTDLFQEAS
jgi:4'-phosphopantetheinyl transferase